MSNAEIYISIDVETAGPSPKTYSLLSIGACDVFNPHETFYIELKPVNQNKISKAMEISQLNWQNLLDDGINPLEAMSQFAGWLDKFSSGENRPIFVAFNAPFDWMFIDYYFQEYLGKNPFGYKALDIKSYYMGMHGVKWKETTMRFVSQRYLENQKLQHHALQDALDQAAIFRQMLAEAKHQSDQR